MNDNPRTHPQMTPSECSGWYAEYRRVVEKRPRLYDLTWVSFDGGAYEVMFVGTGWRPTMRVYRFADGKTTHAI